jgi:uncharacterized protein YqgV (UPF0045/DUF77 family)
MPVLTSSRELHKYVESIIKWLFRPEIRNELHLLQNLNTLFTLFECELAKRIIRSAEGEIDLTNA